MTTLRILLAGGHVYETTCADDAPVIGQLSEAFAARGGSAAAGYVQLEIDVNGKRRGLAIPLSSIVAVETEPPLSFVAPSATITVERAPYIRIPGFLSETDNRAVFDHAVRREARFEATRVETGATGYRNSRHLPSLDDLEIEFEAPLREIVPGVLQHFGMEQPGAITLEKQLTTHNDGQYYRPHNDNGSPGTATRVLTFVYYFHHEPARFSGGNLRLYDSRVEAGMWVAAGTFVELKPENNMLVLFPSRLLHEVLPIECLSHAFADGRFTINGWVRDSTAG
jgi:Rps23 Pro-64 3,4-dihydroxylase Tpa1-like proline 4-hydroxylase